MYSGTTIHTKSGRIMGVHQKIDRVARRHLARQASIPDSFPAIREILHFEGANGPDGLKRKQPGKDEPWHFIDPNSRLEETELGAYIRDHIANLSKALSNKERERAAFEAAWLAHAIVDGLTPAHHYPLEDKLTQLRGGHGLETRNSKRKKVVMPGGTKRQVVRNNWEYWGSKGIMTTHIHFEFGVATAIATMKFDTLSFSDELIAGLKQKGFESLFNDALARISRMEMYEEFTKKGWTRHLARETKDVLVPEIIRVVMAGWLVAIIESESI
ncbi:MAG: hypothetical protein WBK76_03640 [Candidatus Saccharimonadales bacterium]